MRAGVLIALFFFVVAACNVKNDAVVCDSKTDDTPGSCKATYDLCAGGTDVLDCVSGTAGFACKCVENGTTAKTFTSPDACNVSVDTRKKRAEDACGWKLD
jgi:hypothetical protein